MKNITRSILLIAFTTFLLAGCGGNEGETDEPATISAAPDYEGAEGTASVAIDWVGSYKGVTPCADCDGIDTELKLNEDKTYTLTVSYMGKGDGKPVSVSGAWSWKTGNIVQLNGESFGHDQFFVSEGYVVQLDMQGNRVTGDLADRYILKKQ